MKITTFAAIYIGSYEVSLKIFELSSKKPIRVIDHVRARIELGRDAYQKDMIVLIGRVTYVGRTSMEVRVDTYVESIDGIRKPINRAYLTLVAIDADGNPVEVPRLILETEAERAEWEAGIKRREMRDRRRAEGF